MPASTDVNLPKGCVPQFPDRCVVCGADSPGSTVRLVTGSIGWWTWLLWMFSSAVVVKAPACRPCGRSLHLHRWASIAVVAVVATLALVWVWPLVEGSVPRAVRKWAMMGVALGCVLPYIVFQAFFPPPFDVTAYSESIDYEFRDAELAREFAALNADVPSMKVK
jgi:hypothetical protein